MTDFDPAQHRMVSEQRWFEDFVLGERFVIPSRTQTSAVFAAFQTASGDTIYPALEVIELVPGRTTGVVTLRSTVFNQRKELVLEGMQKFLIRRRASS